MTGHLSIIEIRMQGLKPSDMWLVLHSVKPEFGPFTDPEDQLHSGSFPEVHVMPNESVETMDLRFVRGMVVHIVGADKDRCRRALRRVVDFEPNKAITAGPDWLAGWVSGQGYINFLTEKNEK